jgi:hypothetical protein
MRAGEVQDRFHRVSPGPSFLVPTFRGPGGLEACRDLDVLA